VRGETALGLKEEENPNTITLRQPNGARLVWPRLDLLSAQDQTWSLMPEGLEQGLSQQEVADLLAFVLQAN
jgi:putative heme-binding domain-containing protein